tara:strand:+ start:2718 stop:2951 length:234 start_codon:yes stop_codon:yes gene_type:complete
MGHINHSKNADPSRPKNKRLVIRKAIPMDPNAPRRSAFREVIIPERTAYKFKDKDVFEMSSKTNKQAKVKTKIKKKK